MRHSTFVPFLLALVSFACAADSVVPPDSEKSPIVPPESGSGALSFDVIDDVHSTLISGIRDPRRMVIGTASEWEAFWNEFAAALEPRPDPPAIDFGERMVIVAAMGERTTGGYTIAIDEVTEGEDGVTARVVETSPIASCFLAQVITAPVTAVSVTRREGSVVFVEATESPEC